MPHANPNRGDGYRAAIVGISFRYAYDPPGVDLPYDFTEVFSLRSPGEGGEEDLEIIAYEGCVFGQGADFGGIPTVQAC